VDDPRQALREVRRVLAPGGRILISANEYAAREEAAGREPAGWQAVTRRWNAILGDFGVDRNQRPRGLSLPEETIAGALQALGASVERVVLATFTDRRPPRQVAVAHRDRVFSSDWETLEEIHAEAIHRLETWLDTEHVSPDQAFSEDLSRAVLLGTLPS
jgi:hypothetical protein